MLNDAGMVGLLEHSSAGKPTWKGWRKYSATLHIAISKTSAKVVIDCKLVTEKTINAAGNITTDGLEVLGRMVRSRGNKDNSAP
eukprot:superscaffoldBa00008726_g23588